MKLIKSKAGDVLVVSVPENTRIGHENFKEAENALLNLAGEVGSNVLIINLANVSYLASMGIQILVMLQKQIARNGGEMALADPTPIVRRTLELSQLVGTVLALFNSVNEGLAGLGRS